MLRCTVCAPNASCEVRLLPDLMAVEEPACDENVLYRVLQELFILRQDWYRSAGAVNSATTELTADLAKWLWSRENSQWCVDSWLDVDLCQRSGLYWLLFSGRYSCRPCH